VPDDIVKVSGDAHPFDLHTVRRLTRLLGSHDLAEPILMKPRFRSESNTDPKGDRRGDKCDVG
jgi:hypothetical protein